MACPICEKRPPKRFCPAKGEKICAICCGQEREVTIDCLLDCTYLIAAHRYEADHRKPVPVEEFAYPDLEVAPDFVYRHWPVIDGLAHAILAFQARDKNLSDPAAMQAIEALAETFRTLGTGIYYERPPEGPESRSLYTHLAEFFSALRKNQGSQQGVAGLKDSDVFHLLVFLLRAAKHETNGRPRSRAFLGFLVEKFPLPAESAPEPQRIIVP